MATTIVDYSLGFRANTYLNPKPSTLKPYGRPSYSLQQHGKAILFSPFCRWNFC